MDFFKAQDAARRRTWQLGLLFVAAIVTLVLLTNLFVAFAFLLGGQTTMAGEATSLLAAMPADTWGWITAGVVGVIGVATLYKYLRLRGGGRVVAESFGGQLLTREQAGFKETRLLNVVEEMAIASGTPVPPVYLLDEPGINAFAAGHAIEDAVVGISRGAVDTLTRDELQGVIAHEFSHILNGDMRLNLRLIAVLHGILFIGLIGRTIARSGSHSRKNGLGLVLFGVGLVLIGYGGTVFGNMIKAAVSRQREFLADASAVQFTRNPQGIAGALKKIGGLMTGSTINNTQAHEASHLFFGPVFGPVFGPGFGPAGVRQFLGGLFATHPPLDVRIRSIDPRWSGQFPATVPELPDLDPETLLAEDAASSLAARQIHTMDGTAVVESIGNPDAGDLSQAQVMLRLADKALTQATHEAFSATALMYALLLSGDAASRDTQLQELGLACGQAMADECQRLAGLLRDLDHNRRIALLSMSIPALKTLSTAQYRMLQQRLAVLINRDLRIDLFEWMVCVTVLKDLTPHFTGVANNRIRHHSARQVEPELTQLLASLAATAGEAAGDHRQRVEAGFRVLGLELPERPLPQPDFNTVNTALTRLRTLAPLQKPKVLKAVLAVLGHHDGLEDAEEALVRLIAGALDCPVPLQVTAHA